MGKLMAPFTGVAATQRAAWFKEVRTPSELASVTPDNRLNRRALPEADVRHFCT